MALAVLLVLSGSGMLGYVAWEFYGTDIVSRRAQAALTLEIRERWQHPTVSDLLGPDVSPSQGSAIALMRIPRFGPEYEVPLIEGVRDEDLARGIGHFAGAGAGQVGNFALAAHRDSHGEPFHDMPTLRPGDEVLVETTIATYTYQLDTNPNDLIVPFAQTWVIDPVPVAPADAPPQMPTFDSEVATDALITLTTSSELFRTDDRMVAFGHLASTSPK